MYKGRHRLSGHVVALKIINLDTEDDDVADIQKEISLLQRLMHGSNKEGVLPNVIKYYASLMTGPKVWIIMELAEGGSIRTLVSQHYIPSPVWPQRNAMLIVVPRTTAQRATDMLDHTGDPGRLVVPAQEWSHTS